MILNRYNKHIKALTIISFSLITMNLSRNRIWSSQDLIFQGESSPDLIAFAADKESPTTWWTSGTWQSSELCETDGMIQTMKHLVEECSAHHFPGGMKNLHALVGTPSVGWPNWKKNFNSYFLLYLSSYC